MIIKCIICESPKVQEFLDLGSTALANKFLTKEELSSPEPKFPLRVGFCHGCGHVQLMEHVPPGAMFDSYLYISSMSDTLKSHLEDLADVVVKRFGLGLKDLVVDVGSNDGTLLSCFKSRGVKTLGVDPAKNLVKLAEKVGVETHTGFFGLETAIEIQKKHGKASVITATNSFPHIPDLKDYMKGVDVLLAAEGVFVIEAHYLVDLLEQAAFDTVYHEHVSYWSLQAMNCLFGRFGMRVIHAERLPLHHGQLRVFVQRVAHANENATVKQVLDLEKCQKIDSFDTFKNFASKTLQIKKDLRAKVASLVSKGSWIAGYGAPAKGNTLLSFLALGPGEIRYIADRSPLKQGRYTPGTHIPVVAPEKILEDRPDYVILFAWNFTDEIIRQQKKYLEAGGKFIIPVPEVKILP